MGMDWDDLLAYKTESKVRIRSRWLGGMYYFAMIAIFLPYLLYEFYYNNGWGVKYDLTGSLRATVKSNASVSVLPSQTYCQQANAPKPPLVVYPCMNSDDLLTTASGRLSLLVGTRLTTIAETRDESCDEFDITSGCAPWAETNRTPAFIYDVSSSTINVQHTPAPAFEESIRLDVVDTFQERAAPKLIGDGGEAYALPCTGKGVPDPQCKLAGDFFTLATLMDVAGLDLDAPQQDDPTSTKRKDGANVRVNVQYFNSKEYHYRISYNKIEQKTETVDYQNSTYRLVYDLHGLQLNFQQTGGVVVADFKQCLLTIMSALIMLSSAKTLADMYLLYASPRKADYKLWVEQITPDFGPDNDAERMVLEKTLARKRRERDEALGLAVPPAAGTLLEEGYIASDAAAGASSSNVVITAMPSSS